MGNLKDIQRPNHRCENTHCLFKARTKQGYWDNINEKTWHDTGREIVKAIVSSSERKPVIVILDELPEAVSNMKKEGFEGYGEVP